MEKHEEVNDMVLESYEEHKQIKTLLWKDELVSDSEKFAPKLKVLMENVEHHVQEEEEGMFPQVQELMDEADLEELGQELEAAKGKRRLPDFGRRLLPRDTPFLWEGEEPSIFERSRGRGPGARPGPRLSG
jgi:hypothetical protein